LPAFEPEDFLFLAVCEFDLRLFAI